MAVVRRHLRRGVVAWLVAHLLSFTALVPRDCCAVHAHGRTPAPAANSIGADDHAGHGPSATAAPAAAEAPCHEAAPAPPAPTADTAHCDMAAADGAACPMHQSRPAGVPCAMTGVCHQPEAALAAVLWQAAVPPASAAVAAPVASSIAVLFVVESPHALALPPDLPPPRA